jgi:hypothetical protein
MRAICGAVKIGNVGVPASNGLAAGLEDILCHPLELQVDLD